MILLIKVNSALRQVPRRSFLLAPTYPILKPIPWVSYYLNYDRPSIFLPIQSQKKGISEIFATCSLLFQDNNTVILTPKPENCISSVKEYKSCSSVLFNVTEVAHCCICILLTVRFYGNLQTIDSDLGFAVGFLCNWSLK